MSGENSYFSRFFVKFVEVSAAGLASAICAYLLAHFGGLLVAPAPPTAVQVGPPAGETPESRRAQPSPPVEQRSAPQRDTDAAGAQPALKSVKDAKAVAPRKRTKTDTSVTEKERHQKSAEALARAALANVDANRPAPPDAVTEPGLTGTPAPADIPSHRANVPPRQADVGPPQPVAAPPRAGGMEVAPHAAHHSRLARRSRLRLSRTRGCSPPSSGSPMCCAPTRRRPPVKHRARPCRSGRCHLKKNEGFRN